MSTVESDVAEGVKKYPLPPDYSEALWGPIKRCGLPERLTNYNFTVEDTVVAHRWKEKLPDGIHGITGAKAFHLFLYGTGHVPTRMSPDGERGFKDPSKSIRFSDEEKALYQTYRNGDCSGGPPRSRFQFVAALRLFRKGMNLMPKGDAPSILIGGGEDV